MALGTASALLALALCLLLYPFRKVGQRPKGYPPGPPTLPLIGNLHLMPKEKGHLQFQKWAEQYGPIYSLVLGTKVMVILSTDQAVKDLLDKRSAIYSSRPDMYLAQDIASGGLQIALMEYGERWRMLRGIAHKSLNLTASRSYVPYQDLENKAMLVALLDKPSHFIDHIRRYTNSIATQMTFGFRTTSNDDPKLKQLYTCVKEWSDLSGSQGAALLDLYPILRHLPDALLPMRRHAKDHHRREYDLFVGHYLDAKKRLLDGTAKPCICSDIARAQDQLKISDGQAGYLSGSILEAGSDTSASTLVAFIQALLIFPEVASVAQAEIDEVCGDRIPDLNDLPDLPYIRGCVKEIMRWMPTAILGVPHCTTEDDHYLGYHIPKGAHVVLNVWAIHNDSRRYSDPRRFDPTRWADDQRTSSEAAIAFDATKRDQFVFGAGRRICQGMHIADRILFLGISRLLWAFDIKRTVNQSTGEEVIPDMYDLTEGMLVGPKPFEANIKPRNAFKAERVRAEWDSMIELLDNELQWKTVPEGMIWKDYEPGEFTK
ncbi:cytochrome P450 [Xylariaceae sp. FL1272]|nr:cytochrome P450 [Xylariaceae sp. FL1272]